MHSGRLCFFTLIPRHNPVTSANSLSFRSGHLRCLPFGKPVSNTAICCSTLKSMLLRSALQCWGWTLETSLVRFLTRRLGGGAWGEHVRKNRLFVPASECSHTHWRLLWNINWTSVCTLRLLAGDASCVLGVALTEAWMLPHSSECFLYLSFNASHDCSFLGGLGYSLESSPLLSREPLGNS